MPPTKRSQPPRRIRIAKPAPGIGASPDTAKRCIGDTVAVTADIFRDDHEKIRAVVKYKAPGGRRWLETPMHAIDAHINGVRWGGGFEVTTAGSWQFTIEAWTDRWSTWHDELRRKVAADLDEDLSGEVSEGVVLLERAAAKAKGDAKQAIAAAQAVLADPTADMHRKFDIALGP